MFKNGFSKIQTKFGLKSFVGSYWTFVMKMNNFMSLSNV